MDFLKRHMRWVVVCLVLACTLGGIMSLFAAPSDFPLGSIVTIRRGAGAADVAQELSNAHIISYPILLRAALRIAGNSNAVHAGAYLFTEPESVLSVAARLASGDYGFPPVRMTFIEGSTVREDAAQIADALPEISERDFLSAALPYEGYLFPDTYFFQASADATSTVARMRENFDEKARPFQGDIAASGRTLSETVIMASLLEKEAKTSADRRMIAGILYNRLSKKMPLQVDAVFGYIFDRDTYSPSLSDLKVDSPYNTYTHAGLPPTAIGNPGIDAIDAAIHPTASNFLYYLTDKNGVMHYATTFAEHEANKKKFLH